MEQRGLPIDRIRIPRVSDGRAPAAPEHLAAHCIAYAEPVYPAEAGHQHIEGTVVLDVLIGKNGEIQTLSVHEGNPILAGSAMQAVRHWAYRPTTVNGVPVEVEPQTEVPFALPQTG